MGALQNSLVVGFWTALIATSLGTLAALALQRVPPRVRAVFDAMTYIAIIIPGIVIGIATLIFFVNLFGWVNPWLDYVWTAAGLGTPPIIGKGLHTVIAAHVLFTMAIVMVLVRTRLAGMDRSLDRGLLRPLRHAPADLRPDHAAAAPARDRGRGAARVHLQLRRLRHRHLRGRARSADAADVHLQLDPPGHHARDQRHRLDGARGDRHGPRDRRARLSPPGTAGAARAAAGARAGPGASRRTHDVEDLPGDGALPSTTSTPRAGRPPRRPRA